MVAQKQKRAGTNPIHQKRHASHHRQTKHYLKVYWPYVPISIIVLLGIFIGNWHPRTHNGVLAYATQMNISTLLSSTNEKRSASKASTLHLSPQLTAAAQAKANDMTAKNYWSHTTPDGKEPWVFVQNAGYSYEKAGENLAYGFNSSEDVVAGWMNSPSHRENLLDTGYSEVGFGFANAKDFNHDGPQTVVVAVYGTPLGANLAKANQGTQTPSFKAASQTLGVARIQTLTDGRLPWATFAIGLLSGVIIAFVVLRHSIAFHKLLVRGEAFVIHHPWADISLVSVVMVGYVLVQTTGIIR